jgi:hypothetical protein
MRYEVVEDQHEWVVRQEGSELARFSDQDAALQDVSRRMREGDSSASASLSVRYERRTA